MKRSKDVRPEERSVGLPAAATDQRAGCLGFLSRRELFALLVIAGIGNAARGGDAVVMRSGWILRTSDLVGG